MKQATLNKIKSELKKVSIIYDILVTNWNGELKHGNNATYPITIIISVLLHNMSFKSFDCVDYDLNKDIKSLYDNLAVLKELNDYNEQSYMSHFAYTECEFLITGAVISEDF